MPSTQRGSVFRRGDGWAVRFYDEKTARRRQGGFQTRSEALAWLSQKVEEVTALRRGAPLLERRKGEEVTVVDTIQRFLAQHEVDPATHRKLASELRQASGAFGERTLASIRPDELGAWRLTLSPGSRHGVFRAFKQVLEQAARWEWIERNPARHVKNPKPKPPDIQPFTWEEVEAIAEEMDPRFAAIPIFAAGTGLRPEEWLGLERRDVDRSARVVTVERVYTSGVLKPCAKSSRQRRRVPLRQRVLDALDAHPKRLDSPLLFPAARGGRIELEKWRERVWTPALCAAGVPHRRIYDLRHSYATWALAAGISVFTLSRRMGTSLAMIDATYGHLAPDAEDQERALLDAYDAGVSGERGSLRG